MTDGVLLRVRDNIGMWAALEEVPHIKQEMEQARDELEELILSAPEPCSAPDWSVEANVLSFRGYLVYCTQILCNAVKESEE